jgi:predicted Zn finger-like uncharacterized protein
MFTVCPKCTLTLAVTAPDLRIGQGFVRCGRCANVFNALLALSEEPDAVAPGAEPALLHSASGTHTNLPQQPEASAPPSPPPPEPLPTPAPPMGDATPAPAAVAAAAAAKESNLRESRETGTFETIVLEGDGILQTEEFVTEEAVDSQIAQVARQLAANQAASETAEELPPVPEIEPLEAPDVRVLLGPPPRDWKRLSLYGGLIAALVLLLAAQAIHHWRSELALRPGWSGPLTHVYSALGMPLTPNWDVHAYDVRQLGAIADPNGSSTIHVHVSLANHAAHAQPAPILRLTLLDRFGKRVAARDLKPADYLMPNQAQLLQAGQRIEAQIAVADPGPDATSFELDACLIGTGSQIQCANDTPTLPALP